MRRQAVPLASALFAVAALAACGGNGAREGATIDREVFIDTYVDLRLAAHADTSYAITPERRAEILGRRGVDEDRLLEFADVHGRDVDFMNDVWAEVERRLEERSAAPSPAG